MHTKPRLRTSLSSLFPLALCALGSALFPGAGTALAEQTGPQHRLLVANTGRIAIVAPDGTLERDVKSGGLHDASLLPNGNLLFQSSWTKVTELDPQGKVVWEYDSATSNGNAGVPLEVHACQRLENGLTMISESGVGRLIEVDRDGKLVHEIKLVRDRPSKHSDTRLVRSTPTGTYLVAHENDGKVREYNKEGKVVWEFEVPLFGKKPAGGHGPEAFGNHLFSVVRIGNGNTLIGTGNGHSVLEVTPAKNIVWKLEQHDLPGITLAWVTQVSRLPSGNTLFVNCHAGPDNPQIIEVTPEKKVVWTFKDFETFGDSMPVAVVLAP